MSTVYTIGYEGTDIDRFIDTLKAVGVDVLADVRALALSRKRGFSKTALKARLEESGILYRHFADLGDPKAGRDAARAGRRDEFRRIYKKHLATDAAMTTLDNLAKIALDQPVCMLCFERDPKHCHRSLIANELEKRGLNSFDLYGDLPRRYDNFVPIFPRRYFGQSATAAE